MADGRAPVDNDVIEGDSDLLPFKFAKLPGATGRDHSVLVTYRLHGPLPTKRRQVSQRKTLRSICGGFAPESKNISQTQPR